MENVHQIIHNIVIAKAAIHGSEDQLAMQYVYTWVGDALESRRTTLCLSSALLIGNSLETIHGGLSNPVCKWHCSYNQYILHLFDNILRWCNHKLFFDWAPPAGFCEWLLEDSTWRCLLYQLRGSLRVGDSWYGFWVGDLPVFGTFRGGLNASQVFFKQKNRTNPVSIWDKIYPSFW